MLVLRAGVSCILPQCRHKVCLICSSPHTFELRTCGAGVSHLVPVDTGVAGKALGLTLEVVGELSV